MQDVIHMISGPRNISTAMMYSFGNREDTAIVDEPFYAYYLSNFEVEHPGAKEVLASQTADPQKVISDVILRDRKEEYLFVKNMAHHLDGFDYSYVKKLRNVFLIRDPKQLIASFSKVIEAPQSSDIGLKREAELFEELSKTSSHQPIVIDSGELLKNPRKIISELCAKLEIPFNEKMLKWEAGARKEDGSWAEYWYHNVHQSKGFTAQKKKEVVLEDYLIPMYNEVLPFYIQLFEKALKA